MTPTLPADLLPEVADVLSGKRRCTKCARDLSIESFYRRTDTGKPHSWCRACIAGSRKARAAADREGERSRLRASFARLRNQIIVAYGGVCVCCGESEPKFLAIDHIRGFNSPEHAGEPRGGDKLYRLIRRLGFPKDRFRLLCHNCNQARGFYGSCPHEAAR